MSNRRRPTRRSPAADRIAASIAAAGTVAPTTTARSRSDAGWRDGAAARRSATWPPARPATSSSATIRRAPRTSTASATRGWSSPTTPDRATARRPSPAARSAVTRAARPGWSSGSSASGAQDGAAKPEAAADQLDHALRVVEVERACRPVPGRLLGRAGEHEREPPPLADHAGIVAVALADLEDRDVVPPAPEVRGRDLDEAARRPTGGAPNGPSRAGS